MIDQNTLAARRANQLQIATGHEETPETIAISGVFGTSQHYRCRQFVGIFIAIFLSRQSNYFAHCSSVLTRQ